MTYTFSKELKSFLMQNNLKTILNLPSKAIVDISEMEVGETPLIMESNLYPLVEDKVVSDYRIMCYADLEYENEYYIDIYHIS